MNEKLFARLQYMTPQHPLSRLVGKIANCRKPWVKNTFIRWFVRRYQVNMTLAAQENPTAYDCFNDFFTRALKPDARPIAQDPDAIVCPADGAISQLGSIRDGRIFQAKGQDYSTLELLGGDAELAAQFDDGAFATVYLSPRDYHRVHMPYGGTLKRMIAVPGQLFSVNNATANQVPRLFARNERVVSIFETDLGPMAMVLVGAMIVAGTETVWAGEVAPCRGEVTDADYGNQDIRLDKGAEMGRFKLGSTVVLLLPKGACEWSSHYQAGSTTVMGQSLGRRALKA